MTPPPSAFGGFEGKPKGTSPFGWVHLKKRGSKSQVNIPTPTKIGSKMGEFTYPEMGSH